MPRYKDDPRWIETRYPCTCANCGKQIKKRDPAFYYPRTRALYCEADECGGQASRDFHAAAMDEALYNGSAY